MKPNAGRWPLALTVLVLLVLILGPLVMIFARAVIPEGALDLGYALRTIAQEDNLRAVLNSLVLALCVVLLSSVIALPLAWLLARTDIGRHRWLDVVLMIPFMTPPYIASMGWILFMQKRGLFQQLFPFTGAWSQQFFSFFGLVLVMSLHIFPFMMTVMKNAIRNVPASVEESGAVFGAGAGVRMRRILMPLLTGNYAVGCLLVFVKTLSEYGTPATLGRRIGFDVFTTYIHRYATTAPVDFSRAASLSAVLVGICMLAWLLQTRVTARHTYPLVGGKGARRKIVRLNRSRRALSWGYVTLVLLVSIGVPYFSTLATSLIRLRGYGLAAGNFTFQHYIDLFTANIKGTQALRNSMVLAVVSASLAAILGTAVILLGRARSRRTARAVEGLALLPQMLPSIVLVIGMILFWNGIYQLFPLYNTPGIMVVAYVALFLPYTVQYVGSAYGQVGQGLAQAGRVLGGTPYYVLGRITLPLIAPGILSGWMMTFIIAFRELVTASLIAPPNFLVVSTYIMREFEQGSVSMGMAMAVLCVLISTGSLLIVNWLSAKGRPDQSA